MWIAMIASWELIIWAVYALVSSAVRHRGEVLPTGLTDPGRWADCAFQILDEQLVSGPSGPEVPESALGGRGTWCRDGRSPGAHRHGRQAGERGSAGTYRGPGERTMAAPPGTSLARPAAAARAR